MFLKEIFSKKTNLLKESFHKKVLNTSIYEKSFIRGGALSDKDTVEVSDDNSSFSNSYKNKIYRYKNKNDYFKTKVLGEINTSKSLKGYSLHNQNFLYKNRKNESLRFHSSVLKPLQCENFLDILCKSFKSFKRPDTYDNNSLLVLAPRRGGFSCYASGLLGFLPKKHGNSLFCKMLLTSVRSEESVKRLENILFITRTQSFHFLLRLQIFASKLSLVFRKRRKKFSSSRKRGKSSTYRRYTMTFLSRTDS